jgi:pyruvate/2-oxoglutarate dehydrogenase complex dihydrolipoamide dehydrogenase (E3) component
VDLAQVRRRKQAIVEDFRTGGQRKLEEAENVELIFGEGRFTAPRVLEVTLRAGGVRTLTADAIFINTGDRPA